MMRAPTTRKCLFRSGLMLLLAGMLSTSAEAGLIGVSMIEIKSAIPSYIQVSEVVATQTGTGIDVALATNGGSATSFSTITNESLAIDGVFPSSFPDIYHSLGNTSVELLRIVLASAAELDSITIYGRVDCCSERDVYDLTLFDTQHNVLFAKTGADASNTTNHAVTVDLPNTARVPEPGSLALLGLGIAGLRLSRRKQA